MPSMTVIIKTVLITMGVMFLANQVSAMNPTARRYLKGSPVAPVAPVGNDNEYGVYV